jgi:tetratricopeptide (TPR) repeat protein
MTWHLIDTWQSPESFWSRVIDVDPEVVAYKERGRLYHAAGKYDAAIRDFSAAMGIADGGFRASIYNLYAFRGESLRAAGRYDEAVRDFDAAIALLPQPVYYYHRGLALKALGRVGEAEEDFRRAGQATGPLDWY